MLCYAMLWCCAECIDNILVCRCKVCFGLDFDLSVSYSSASFPSSSTSAAAASLSFCVFFGGGGGGSSDEDDKKRT